MKLLVTLCVLVGAALAQQAPQFRQQYNNGFPQYQQYQQQQYQQAQYQQYLQRAARAPILAYSNDVNPDGSFQYSYQTGDGINAQAAGYTRNLGLGPNVEAQVVQGSYSYTGPDGVVYTVNYIADENGYRAQGAHLPTPPAVAAVTANSLGFFNNNNNNQQAVQAARAQQFQQQFQQRQALPFQQRRF